MALARLPAGVSFPALPDARTDSSPAQPTHPAPPALEVTQRPEIAGKQTPVALSLGGVAQYAGAPRRDTPNGNAPQHEKQVR